MKFHEAGPSTNEAWFPRTPWGSGINHQRSYELGADFSRMEGELVPSLTHLGPPWLSPQSQAINIIIPLIHLFIDTHFLKSEVSLTCNKLHIFKVYNLISFAVLYTCNQYNHCSQYKHTHQPQKCPLCDFPSYVSAATDLLSLTRDEFAFSTV